MPVNNYTYTGPVSGITLADGSEVTLNPGKVYPFNSDDPYTQTMERMKYLKPAPGVAKVKAETKPKAKKKEG